ncbi:hypothetical protein [Clostridium sp. JS66]|uniref:hypothetical protein n=1 Tax=Clostridium sp. JS66 TaxID=3064705 RepID=UPI00298DB23A|nr:hypothetical protein [Clostridium sp. JS66]WPC43857.1 hypothetical protein Q6H37_10380 [Clostridium sp. JS66]
MTFCTMDLKDFIERIRKEDTDAISHLYKSFEGYIFKTYNDRIGNIYGNQYWEDYQSDVILSIVRAASNFNGTTKNSFNRCIFKTISHCEKRIYTNKCKHIYKYLDDENDLYYIEKNFTCSENSILNQVLFNNELVNYLKHRLKPLEIELFECFFYKKETLKYFSETHNLNYSSVRSTFRRMLKKIEYKEIKSLLELKHSLFLFIACIIGGCL